MRGSRVQTIVNELHGEKIDIIKWTEDLPTLISESLSPAEIQRVLIDQDNKRIDIILTEENLSKAIGRRGQNVRLASKLTNFEIDILTDKEDSERRQAEFKDRTETLIKNLEVDETLGQLLVSEGFNSIEEISQSTPEDISKIDAIDEETANELINRSKETLIKEKDFLVPVLTCVVSIFFFKLDEIVSVFFLLSLSITLLVCNLPSCHNQLISFFSW